MGVLGKEEGKGIIMSRSNQTTGSNDGNGGHVIAVLELLFPPAIFCLFKDPFAIGFRQHTSPTMLSTTLYRSYVGFREVSQNT